MTRLRFKPCQQGNLDGLCGLYALINALGCLCPKADQAACERVFAVLIGALGRHHRSPLAVIHRGLNRYELLRLVHAWQRFAAREFGITLTISRLQVSKTTLGGVWQGLCQALDGRSVVLVNLDGVAQHWTVVYAATERTLEIADSGGMRRIDRSRCTLGPTRKRWRLHPSELLIARRH